MVRFLAKHKILLLVVLSFFASFLFIYQSTYAETKISKNQIKLVADFINKVGQPQGGFITPEFFVYLDCKGHCSSGSYVRVANRNTCKAAKNIKLSTYRLSGIYNKWGTNLITLINRGAQVGCYNVNGSKATGCITPPGRALFYQGTQQGITSTYNGYTYKVAGYSGAKIGVWNSSGSLAGTYIIPAKTIGYGEPEGISIDGNTGEAYLVVYRKKSGKYHTKFYKIDSSVFSSFTGKKGTSNPVICKKNKPANKKTSSSSSSSSSSKSSSSSSSSSSQRERKTGWTSTRTFTPAESHYDGITETTFFGNLQDDGNGCGVFSVLNFILEILTWGIGIAGVIGISLSGSMYLTAKGDEAQTTKAKRRIYEITIGLAAYAIIWVIISWLLPGGALNNSNTCETISNSALQEQRAQKQTEEQKEETATSQNTLYLCRKQERQNRHSSSLVLSILWQNRIQ